MLEETGTVVRIEEDALWVETLQQSACGHCAARQGCGQHVLGKALATSSTIRVLLNGIPSSNFRLNQSVRIGIPGDVVVRGSLLVYLVPLAALIAGANFAYWLAGTEGGAVLGALAGLAGGGLLVRLHAGLNRNNSRIQPVVLDSGSGSASLTSPSL